MDYINKAETLYNRIQFPNESFRDVNAFLKAHQEGKITSIRLNPLKNATQQFAYKNNIPWCSQGYYLSERPSFTLDPNLHAGAYYVQEASSMFTGYAFEYLNKSNANLLVLDLCAAPGGKSTHIASLLDESSLLISNEVIQTRASILSENIIKWGNNNNWVTNADPTHFSSMTNMYNTIIVDAPCTGSGLWRRDDNAMDEWSEANVKLCSERQKRILADIYPALSLNGYIIYSTCSFSREENEDIVDWMLEEFDVESVQIPIQSEWNIIETISNKQNGWGYRFHPWKLAGEGFFLSVFKKKSSSSFINKKHSFKNIKTAPAPSTPPKQCKDWVTLSQPFFFEFMGDWKVISLQHKFALEALQYNNIKLKKVGTTLGKFIKQELIPHEELAFSTILNNNYEVIDVDYEYAIKFLRKDEFHIENVNNGWKLIRFNGNGLGWVKCLPNRMNNYYPKNWRVKMN